MRATGADGPLFPPPELPPLDDGISWITGTDVDPDAGADGRALALGEGVGDGAGAGWR